MKTEPRMARRPSFLVMLVFARWWLIAPLLALLGALGAWARQPGDVRWPEMFVGAVWGACLGLLSIPLSMEDLPKALGAAALIVAGAGIAAALLLGWNPFVAGVVGAALGLLARWWAPHAPLP